MQRAYTLSNMTVTQGEALEWGRRTYVMGVINVTPDSFSGDGLGSDIQATVELALRFEEEGADMIDIGAESTRPGSSPISVDEELARLVPALEAISGRIRVPISVDTYKSQVARHALQSGAMIVNDVWGLKADPKIAEVAAEFGSPLVIMHNQKTRKYRDLVPDIRGSLSHVASQSPVGRGSQIIRSSSTPASDSARPRNTIFRCCGISASFGDWGIQFSSALRASPQSVSCWASRKISGWKAPPPRLLCPLPVAPT